MSLVNYVTFWYSQSRPENPASLKPPHVLRQLNLNSLIVKAYNISLSNQLNAQWRIDQCEGRHATEPWLVTYITLATCMLLIVGLHFLLAALKAH